MHDGRLAMAETPNALVKDLLSTGYFFEDLKHQSKSTEIDLPSYSRNFVVPYLTRISKSHKRSGQSNRSKILDFAVKYLSDVNDDEVADSIFGLKKVAAYEMASNEKTSHQTDQSNKSELLSCRQKSESAQSLAKLLVSIIRVFKLTEVIVKREKSEGMSDSIGETIKDNWELSVMPGI
jgi:hypothetical protein